MTEGITLVEVGPRDGLQNLKAYVPTDRKISLIERLAASGIREIQTGAFVHPRAIPQFRDMEAVLAGLKGRPGLEHAVLTALVPNLEGAEAAVACGLRKIDFFFSASRSHNLNNVRKTPEASLDLLEGILRRVIPGRSVTVRVNLATAFGCPFEGYPTTESILRHVQAVAALGVREITLCDTVGYGFPSQVEEILQACFGACPDVSFGVHFHNTRGLGLANALKAFDAGVRVFDAAIGGLGGCPFAPGASGNVATEDMTFMFNQMGIPTGIRLEGLLEAARYLQGILPDVPLSSALLQAGPPVTTPWVSGALDPKGETGPC